MDTNQQSPQPGREAAPDEYQVKWARSRMWATRAENNYEARERLRASADPSDRRALQILELNDAARIAARQMNSPNTRQQLSSSPTEAIALADQRAQGNGND